MLIYMRTGTYVEDSQIDSKPHWHVKYLDKKSVQSSALDTSWVVVCEDVALFRVLGIDPGGGGRNPIVFPCWGFDLGFTLEVCMNNIRYKP
jgi:hypothetical protein